MKKKTKKNSVHPVISDQLAILPAAIFTLTLTLSPQDKEVLAYLLLNSAATTATDHSPLFNCTCFRCYITYWARWDSSPNRHLIHQIIDAYEAHSHSHAHALILNNKPTKTKFPTITTNENAFEVAESTRSPELDRFESVADCEHGPVRKLVSFLGERIWSVWT